MKNIFPSAVFPSPYLQNCHDSAEINSLTSFTTSMILESQPNRPLL